MQNSDDKPQGYGVGVDWRRPGPLAPAERNAIIKWYSELHGEGDLSLSGFLTFWLKHDDEVFKQYRRLVEASFVGGAPSETVSFLLFLPSYVVAGYEPGVLYEVIGCHKTGVTRQQVLDAIALGFVHAGPMGMNGIAKGTDEYLTKWTQDITTTDTIWPQGWHVDGDAFKAGLDFSTPGMTPEEIARLEQWYKTHQGEVPAYVPFFAKHNPEALKACRARYERAVNTIPKQMIPLMMFHTAAMQKAEPAMRRYAFQAKSYGVKKSEMMEVITFMLLYTGDLTSDGMVGALASVIDGWKD